MRVPTKSSAGERVLRLPAAWIEMLQRRAADGIRQEEPVSCDALGAFRALPTSAEISAGPGRLGAAQVLRWHRNRVGLVEADWV